MAQGKKGGGNIVPGTLYFNSGTNFTGVSYRMTQLNAGGEFDTERNAQQQIGGVGATSLWALTGDVADLFTRPDVNVTQEGSTTNVATWALVVIGILTLYLLWKSHKT